jgi:hypothetical protein
MATEKRRMNEAREGVKSWLKDTAADPRAGPEEATTLRKGAEATLRGEKHSQTAIHIIRPTEQADLQRVVHVDKLCAYRAFSHPAGTARRKGSGSLAMPL